MFAIGATGSGRTVPFEILPHAVDDLLALHKQRGVADSVFEFELLMVEGNNTLLPDTHDEGRSIIIRLTLEGRPVVPARLGEPTTAAITLACVCFVIMIVLVNRYWRKAKKRQQKEERLAHELGAGKELMSVNLGLAAPPKALDSSRSNGSVRTRRRAKQSANFPAMSVLDASESGLFGSVNTAPIGFGPEGSNTTAVDGAGSAHYPEWASSSVVAGAPKDSPSKFGISSAASVQVNVGSPLRRKARGVGSPMDHGSRGSERPSSPSSKMTPIPLESHVEFQRSPFAHPETVLSPGGVSLFGVDHMVSHNARVRSIRLGLQPGEDEDDATH